MSNNKMLKWAIVVASVILMGLMGWSWVNLAFSFSTMLLVAWGLIVLEYLFYMLNPMEVEEDYRRRSFAITLVGCYGLFAIFTMSNYFYPPMEVFSNNDHHAIAVEGIETTDTSLLLAADDRNAFFDDRTMEGRIELINISHSDSTATLRISGAGMPVYSAEKDSVNDEYYYVVMEGQNNIHSWMPNEQLELINDRNQPVAGIRVNYDSTWNWKHFRTEWQCTYIIDYRDDSLKLHSDTSAFNSIIRLRYPLGKIFPGIGVLNGVDLSKVELLRPKARMTNSPDDDADLSKSPFLVCYSQESGLSGVRSGSNMTPVGRRCVIPVRLDGTSHFVGLKSRIPGFLLTADTLGHTAIRYRMPLYRYLSTEGYEKGEDGYYTFMVATTLVDETGDVNSQIPQNVLLYDVFDHVDNIYQMDPQFVSFQRGRSLDTLDLAILDINNNNGYHIKAGDRLLSVGTSAAATEWIVSLDNFRDPSLTRPSKVENPQSSNKFLWFMLILTGLCCISLTVKSQYQHTYIEPVAYIIFLSLLAIRLTLLWRISVFPPASGITIEEFNKWRTGGDLFTWVQGFCYGFIVLVFLTKRFGFVVEHPKFRWLNLNTWLVKIGAFLPTFNREREGDTMHDYLWPQGKRALWLLVCFGLYLAVFLAGLIWSKPILHVGLPILVYFATDIVINIQVGSRWTDRGNHSYAFFWQQLMNMMVASAVMFVLDHGYGLIFFVFSLFAMILRLLDLYGGNTFNKNTGEGIHLSGIVLMAALLVVGTIFMRRIFIGFVTGGTSFLVIAALVMALFVALLIWTINSWREFIKWNVLIVILAAGVTIGVGSLFKHMVDNKPTGYRVMVLDNEPSKVLGKVTTPPDMRKFLNASLNDWVLGENIERGKSVNSLIGKKGLDYYKLQPHSNVGVSWMTQLTDLSVSRFIIAEQSNLVPVLLIFLFLVMELVAFAFPSDRRWARSLLTQIPLLLAIQSLMVWMAVTRRFIFIGQDFPMISLLSRVNLIVSIFEFFIWILIAIIEHRDMRMFIETRFPGIDTNELEGFIDGDSDNKYYRTIRKWTPAFGLGLILIFASIIIIGKTKNHFTSDKNLEGSTYDVVACVDTLKVLIADPKAGFENIEILFREYQDHYIDSVNRTRPQNQIYDITALETPQNIIKGFCKMNHYNPDDKDADNAINRVFKRDEEFGPFAQAAFNDFITRKMYYNDIDELIYIVKRRYVLEDDNENENVRYAFGVTPRYFRQQLPRRTDQAWRGSVKSETAFSPQTVDRQTEGYVTLYTIPASWTKDHQLALIVKPNTNRLSVVGKYEPRPLARNESYPLSEGEVLFGRNAPNLTKYGIGNYVARNVFINSQAQFIYPMQSSFYWARPLAEQTRSYMMHSMKEAKGKRKTDSIMSSNAEVTLSIEMTRNLANVMERHAQKYNVAVVVADGDGKVRALVEHKKHRYVINPNNARRIEFVDDSLKREGLLNFGNESERYFGNKAILWLDNGPGSSQKPIVWTAVTTQFSGWDWNLLEMAKINSDLILKYGKYFDATHFGGAKVKKTKHGSYFHSFKNDEGGGSNHVDLRAYMRMSSNFYNAIMVYIGSHTRAELAMGQPADNPMFTPRSASWLTDNRESSQKPYREEIFPLVRFNNAIYSFSRPLSNENVRRGILLDGLSQNFGLPVSVTNDKKSDLHKSMNNAKRIANYYAFPAISYFNNAMREGTDTDVATEGVKMTAIGKNSVWLVSPLKMAEMYGKLVSFNSNYRLTIDPSMEKLPYQALSTDGDANAYLNMRNQHFIPGLHEVYTNSAQNGTAAGNKIYNKISSNLGNYFIYGKTGTIDGRTDGHDVEDHLLAVIITNRDLATMNEVSNFNDEKFRFYIIYIADFDHKHDSKSGGNWLSVDPEIINTVLQSEEFNKYMEGK